ncbi:MULTISPECIES: tetratricopeptide repeat protein [unclassified Moorena]|uniref:tetratricopeptide repeat protein n=1 Tax=unclassified Moorena TaxID=2683338 RepID=UPI0013CBB1BC|nr:MULTISPECIES: tetratricopeptide repeat protein [unclassified Moorena]NEO22481.1 tetratricopeptide repeat protein [Moorena sp. SIO4A5]NEQ60491.1 tetratricopeptide repeat protein [Moorena sp. SIO4A1]
MSILELYSTLKHYEAALTAVEKTDNKPSAEAILRVLIARNIVHEKFADIAHISKDKLIKLIELDSRLKKQAGLITQTVQLADLRIIFHPPKDYWWWFLEAPTHPRDHLDWFWNAGTVALLTASVSLVVDISSRFLSTSPGFLGSFAVISQSALTLLTAGGILTKAGRTGIEDIQLRLGIKKYLWQEVKLGLSGVLLISLIGFRASLPLISDYVNEKGVKNYDDGDWSSAQSNYERALSLNPDNADAHYNLGRIYEDLQDFKKARTQYRLAAQGGLDAAYNELGRLYIQDKKYSQAVSLLLTGLENMQEEDIQNKLLKTEDIKIQNDTQYALLKNLGWARLKQGRYADAETYLRDAIELDKILEEEFKQTPAAAHCLLAQVIENKPEKDPDNALAEWKICLRYTDIRNPDEDIWVGMARERIDAQDKTSESTK